MPSIAALRSIAFSFDHRALILLTLSVEAVGHTARKSDNCGPNFEIQSDRSFESDGSVTEPILVPFEHQYRFKPVPERYRFSYLK